jgi:hypothetical protein
MHNSDRRARDADEQENIGGTPVTRRTVLTGLTAGVAAAMAAPIVRPGVAHAATAVKYRPGHYVWPDGFYWSADKQINDFRAIDEIAANPYVKGIKIDFNWAYFEKTAGDYSGGFAIVDAYLDKLSKAPAEKNLILHVTERSFGNPTTNVYPSYVINNGWVAVRPEGESWSGGLVSAARMWQPEVMDRLIAMSRAYAARYDAHPRLAMYGLNETALGVQGSGYSNSAYYAQLKRWFTASKTAWTRTPVRLSANYAGSDTDMLSLFSQATTAVVNGGAAVGGPDPELPLPDVTRTIQANRLFRGEGGGTDLRGVVPWVGEVQAMGLGVKYTETPAEIFDYEFTTMHANYMIWMRNTWTGGDAQKWPAILAYINSIQGRIHTAPPTRGSWTVN